MTPEHTATITITRRPDGGLDLRHRNGEHNVLLAVSYPPDLKLADPYYLYRDGAPLREVLPGVSGRDLLDLLAMGKAGDHEVADHRPTALPSRRDMDFGEQS